MRWFMIEILSILKKKETITKGIQWGASHLTTVFFTIISCIIIWLFFQCYIIGALMIVQHYVILFNNADVIEWCIK